MEVETFRIDDKDYIILETIENNNNIYYYLVNANDSKDIMVRKEDPTDRNYLIPLESNEEFDKVILLFTNKHIKDEIE